jgi:hypothetical protein
MYWMNTNQFSTNDRALDKYLDTNIPLKYTLVLFNLQLTSTNKLIYFD